jgi:hypothetical protein
MSQAEDRIHRIGSDQNKSTNYYYLIGENSLDEVLMSHLETKIKLISTVIDGREEEYEFDREEMMRVVEYSEGREREEREKESLEKKREFVKRVYREMEERDREEMEDMEEMWENMKRGSQEYCNKE